MKVAKESRSGRFKHVPVIESASLGLFSTLPRRVRAGAKGRDGKGCERCRQGWFSEPVWVERRIISATGGSQPVFWAGGWDLAWRGS